MSDELPSRTRERVAVRVGTWLKEKWHLDRLLGVGGMAAVYAATHRTGHTAAVKILHAELLVHESVRARFVREPVVANRVRHPGIVRVLDDDVAEDGAPFLVMELLEGETLEDLWRHRGGKLPPDEALAITDKLLDVLAAAHGAGIVHRDVKPQNVFLTWEGILKLMDFGIARASEGSYAQTQVGASLGTPAFMPPEQARGRWDQVDERSDIWAAGATLFALLSGHLVHEAESQGELHIIAATTHARSITDLVPDTPEAVVRVLKRALAFDKGDRWANAAAMQRAVRHAMVERSAPKPTTSFSAIEVGPGGTVVLKGPSPALPGSAPSPAVPDTRRFESERPPTGAPVTGEVLGAADMENGWFVSDGTHTVGPVTLDLLMRGIDAGKVPEGCLVCHQSWKEWRPLAKPARVVPVAPSVAVVEPPKVPPSPRAPRTARELAAWRVTQGLNVAAAAEALFIGRATVERAEAEAPETPLGPALRRALERYQDVGGMVDRAPRFRRSEAPPPRPRQLPPRAPDLSSLALSRAGDIGRSRTVQFVAVAVLCAVVAGGVTMALVMGGRRESASTPSPMATAPLTEAAVSVIPSAPAPSAGSTVAPTASAVRQSAPKASATVHPPKRSGLFSAFATQISSGRLSQLTLAQRVDWLWRRVEQLRKRRTAWQTLSVVRGYTW